MKDRGKRASLRSGEDDEMVMLRLEDAGLFFRCDWKDTVEICGSDLLHFAYQQGLPKEMGSGLMDALDQDAPIDALAQSLRKTLEEARLTLLQIDERSDGWLYAIVGSAFAKRWEMTRLSYVYAVITPQSATRPLSKGLHDGPRLRSTKENA
nr:hypothetical protein [Pseudooceanicola lipolyticus]